MSTVMTACARGEVVVLGSVDRAIRIAREGVERVRLFEMEWEGVDAARERVCEEGLEGRIRVRHVEAWRVLGRERRSLSAG